MTLRKRRRTLKTSTFRPSICCWRWPSSRRTRRRCCRSRWAATRDAILQGLTSVRGNQRVTDQNPEGKYQALDRYAKDLTELARRGNWIRSSVGMKRSAA